MAAKKKGILLSFTDNIIEVYGKEKIARATMFGILCFVCGFYYVLEIKE